MLNKYKFKLIEAHHSNSRVLLNELFDVICILHLFMLKTEMRVDSDNHKLLKIIDSEIFDIDIKAFLFVIHSCFTFFIDNIIQ